MTENKIDFLFDQGHQLLNLAKKKNVDEVQLTIVNSLEIGTRFGENHITQNTLTDITELDLTLVKDLKIGKISVNLPKPGKYSEIIEDCDTILKFSEPDKDFPGFITKSRDNKKFQNKNRIFSVEGVSDSVKGIINSALSYDSAIKTVAGNINTFNDSTIFMNSHGVQLWNNSSRISSVINISAVQSGNDNESRSAIKVTGGNLENLQLEKNTDLCAERAKRGLNQSSIEIGTYKTILSPTAVAELIFFIAMGSSAESLVTHTSFLKDKIGDQVFDNNLTITDERDNPNHFFSSPYDSDGTPVESIKYIDQGILKEYAYNRRLAKKLINADSNGRNLQGFGGEMPLFGSNTITPGIKSEEDLINSVDDGIYIVNLFYNNFVNPPEGLCTGLTRDGLFQIKNGEIIGSLKNMRWTDKLESIFNKIEVGSNSVQMGGFYFGSTITPSIKTEKFSFSSVGKH